MKASVERVLFFMLTVPTFACAQAASTPTSPLAPSVSSASLAASVIHIPAGNDRLTAVMQFGQPNVGSPFPPSADHDQSSHAKDNLVPRTVVIDGGGTVTFDVPAGAHQIAIYEPGTEPEDINTAALVALCPGPSRRLIDDPIGRVALITHACGSPWQADFTFDQPGRYLVICAFLPHFQVGMFGWVEVRDRGRQQ